MEDLLARFHLLLAGALLLEDAAECSLHVDAELLLPAAAALPHLVVLVRFQPDGAAQGRRYTHVEECRSLPAVPHVDVVARHRS